MLCRQIDYPDVKIPGGWRYYPAKLMRNNDGDPVRKQNKWLVDWLDTTSAPTFVDRGDMTHDKSMYIRQSLSFI